MKRYAGYIAFAVLAVCALWLGREDGGKGGSPPPVTSSQRNDTPAAKNRNLPQGSGFDFYVLSLSWSPTFCSGAEADSNRQQCGSNRAFGFVVHGLWPQNESGYPEFCNSREPQRVPDTIGRPMFDIMPSMGLIGHQWRKHGACSGLSQKDYFALTRAAFESVKLPPEISAGNRQDTLSTQAIENAFVAANPGMSPRGIATSCQGRKLEEVRICLNRDLSFRDCAEVDRQGCTSNATDIPPIR